MSGFQSPNYTQTPNDLFDWLKDMAESELRVTLVMVRQTFGFHRDGFRMSLRKIANAAGLSRNGALAGAEAAEKRGTFRRINRDAQNEAEWELVVQPVEGGMQPVNTHMQPVEAPPPASEVQVGVKEIERKEGKKGDLVDGIIHYQFKPKAIRDAFRDYFKLTPNWEAKYNRQFLEWAVEAEMTAERVRTAADRWRTDKRFNWGPPSLRGIQEHWLELIEKSPADAPIGPAYKPFVGAPDTPKTIVPREQIEEGRKRLDAVIAKRDEEDRHNVTAEIKKLGERLSVK